MPFVYNGEQYDAIDFHVHTFPDKIAEKAVSKLAKISQIEPCTKATVESNMEMADKVGLIYYVSLNIATSPNQQETINNAAKELNDIYKDRFTSFGSVHFLNPNVLNEVNRVKELGLKGIKLHPDYQDFMVDDKTLYPIYDLCSQLDLPIVFHSGWDCYSPDVIHAPPRLSRKVLNDFPKLKMILAHFGGLKMWDDVEEYLIGKNVYLDTAMCYSYAPKEKIENLIKKHDSNLILLGSDCPWEYPEDSIKYILNMDLSREVKEKILSKNAKRILCI